MSDDLAPIGGSSNSQASENSAPSLAPIGGGGSGGANTMPTLGQIQQPVQQTPPPAGSSAATTAAAPGMMPPPPSGTAAPRPPVNPAGGATASPLPGTAYPARTPAAPAYEDPDSGTMRKILLGFGGVVLAAILVGAYFLFRTPPPVPAPTGFTAFTAQNDSFRCETPNGWNLQPTGKAGVKTDNQTDGILMTNGNAQIRITMVDIAGQMQSELLFGKEIVPESMGGSRANSLHKRSKKVFAARFKEFKETPYSGGIPSKMGGIYFNDSKEMVPDTKMTEFTASSNRWGLGGPVHGFRASLGGGQLIAAVTCYCSERDWEKLKPAFLHVIGSVEEIRHANEDEEGGGGNLGVPGGGGSFPMPPGTGR